MRRELERVEIPGEHEARERTRTVVLAGFADRPVVPRRRSWTPVLAAAFLLAVVAGLLSPPGRAVLGELREVVGVERSQPALFSLPAKGRVLAVTGTSAWTVSADGSTRLLGPYRDAAWSPFGRFVAVATPLQLTALEPDGDKRWSLARPDVRLPAWGGTQTDTRIAYLTRSRLHVVAGDGTGDAAAGDLPAAAEVRPAWRPGPGHVLAYADRRGRVVVYNMRGGVQFRTGRLSGILSLAWSSRGALLVVSSGALVTYGEQGQRVARRRLPGIRSAEYAPDGGSIAVAREGEVLLLDSRTLRTTARVFAGRGPFVGASWSPDGRWLLVSWPAADQWVFVQVRGGRRVTAASNITRQFDGFPSSVSWCCP